MADEDDNDDQDGTPVVALLSPDRVKLETVVDSGAAEAVAPVEMAPWVPVQESRGIQVGLDLPVDERRQAAEHGRENVSDIITPEGHLAQSSRLQR